MGFLIQAAVLAKAQRLKGRQGETPTPWRHLILKNHKRRARFKSLSAAGNHNSNNHLRASGVRSREELFWKLFGSLG
jgi:hypothetical protein